MNNRINSIETTSFDQTLDENSGREIDFRLLDAGHHLRMYGFRRVGDRMRAKRPWYRYPIFCLVFNFAVLVHSTYRVALPTTDPMKAIATGDLIPVLLDEAEVRSMHLICLIPESAF